MVLPPQWRLLVVWTAVGVVCTAVVRADEDDDRHTGLLPLGDEPATTTAAAVWDTKSVGINDHDDNDDHSLWPLSLNKGIGFALAALGLVIAAAGGMGGGGMLVPIYILVLSLMPQEAIPLSNVTVLGAALALLTQNLFQNHPTAHHRPLIDWDIILLMLPVTLSGALFGATLNAWLPDLVIVLALVILLGVTAYTTYRQAVQLRQREKGVDNLAKGWHSLQTTEDEETQVSSSQHSDAEAPVIMEQSSALSTASTNHDDTRMGTIIPPLPSPEKEATVLVVSRELEEPEETDHDDDIHQLMKSTATTEEAKAKNQDDVDLLLQHILRLESQPPYRSIAITTGLFVFVLLTNLVKGGGSLKSPVGVQCGSLLFWSLDGLIVLATNGVSLYARSHLLHQSRQKVDAGYVHLDTDIRWDETKTLVYPALGSLVGVAAGLFGIGSGGLLQAPLLLALGVHPMVAAATSATMILFTSFTATTSFVVYGLLLWDYGIVCFCIGFCATWMGQLAMSSIIRRTGRTSYIAFCITGVVVISAVSMSAEWGVALTSETEHSSKASFCGAA